MLIGSQADTIKSEGQMSMNLKNLNGLWNVGKRLVCCQPVYIIKKVSQISWRIPHMT